MEVYASRDHAGLEEMARLFLAAHPADLDYACFGVAAVIENGHAETTNLAWTVDADSVARVLGLKSVALINDLAANAYGIAELRPGDFEALNPGAADPDGTVVVISAGTGLGEAGLLPEGDTVRRAGARQGITRARPATETANVKTAGNRRVSREPWTLARRRALAGRGR